MSIEKNSKFKIINFSLGLFFVIFSFIPAFYEIYHIKDLPKERIFVLEHNYMFDYNFYLSRIRQGQEGKWLVSEKYFNQPHAGSLFQIIYLYLGKIGGLFNLSPPAVYHLSRFVMGLVLLTLIGRYSLKLFPGFWGVICFLIIVTSGSFPILVKVGEFFRFATYMGWWSVIDSLQRITFIPHVLLGQIILILVIWRFKENKTLRLFNLIMWGLIGFIAGIIFPPTLIVVYIFFGILSVVEFFQNRRINSLKEWVGRKIIPRAVFTVFSFPSLIYLKLMLGVSPWNALALFDIEHRIILPYREYALALGPVLPLGIIGLILAVFRREKKFMFSLAWILGIAILFIIFENVPEQSPSRFTEALIHVPLGIMTTYFFYTIYYFTKSSLMKRIVGFFISIIIILGFSVMVSMVLWLCDQAYGKRVGTWQVPVGTQIVYPLKDFMEGVIYLRDNTPKKSVVLGYITAGNFIPAYAGNYVYLGHANTPRENDKEKIAAGFFSGKMTQEEAKNFLTREKISYIYFGPQEKEIGGLTDLTSVYSFLMPIYQNNKVVIYRFKNL